jgi:hypothetical protein
VLPSLLPFGLADALFSTHDFKTALQTLAIYFSLLTRQLTKRQKVAIGLLAGAMLVLWTTRGRRKGSLRK